MSVEWAETALDQLATARTFFARSSPAYAMALVGRVVDRAEALDGQPLVGAEVPEYGDPAIREVYEHPYRIVYRVNGDEIHIVAVIHAARRMPTTPPI